ncbi:MAG: hypothetical protein RMA76_31905 [Deltaproteobacteria bacterium]|jgi:hypothetical protein
MKRTNGLLFLGLWACTAPDGPVAERTEEISVRPDPLRLEAGPMPGDDATTDVEVRRFGGAVATGDFDADGTLEIVVGMPTASDGDTGRFAVYAQDPAGPQLLEVFTPAALFGAVEEVHHFGTSVAVGNINCDGYDDLILGFPELYAGTLWRRGAIALVPGGPNGLDVAATQTIHRQDVDPPLVVSYGARFGSALAVGDFDGDGCADLAVGAETLRLPPDRAGGVYVFPGTSAGPAVAQVILITADGVPGTAPRYNARFGHTLAVGDFNGDLRDDLAIGAPFDNVPATGDHGEVVVLDGGPTGLDLGTARTYDQDVLGLPKSPLEPGVSWQKRDEFGTALAAADVDGDGIDDLAVGLGGYNFDDGTTVHGTVGAAALLLGRSDGDLSIDAQYLFLSDVGLADIGTQFGDRGFVLADLDEDGRADLAVSATDHPGDGGPTGIVALYYGDASGFTTERKKWLDIHDVDPSWDSVGLGHALAAGDLDGDGHVDLIAGAPYTTGGGVVHAFEPLPPFLSTDFDAGLLTDGLGVRYIADKIPEEAYPLADFGTLLTGLVVVEAIEAGRLSDRSVVTVPPSAIVGGRSMGLVAGDRIEVRDLLAGLILANANDAAVTLAIATSGTEGRFVDAMDATVARLGLVDTHVAHPHGRNPADVNPACRGARLDDPVCGHSSNAQELVVLARAAIDQSRYRNLAVRQSYVTSTWRDAAGRAKDRALCNGYAPIRLGDAHCSASPHYDPDAVLGLSGDGVYFGYASRGPKSLLLVGLGAAGAANYASAAAMFAWGFTR